MHDLQEIRLRSIRLASAPFGDEQQHAEEAAQVFGLCIAFP